MSHGHDDNHGHGHPPYLAHHFDTPAQQFENGKLGMWVFLGTEILMFGGLFALYALYRANHTEIYTYAHQFLNWKLGVTNTAILLASSYTMVMGVRAATLGQKKALVAWLVLTFMGGCGFFAIKSIEYGTKFEHGLYPGRANIFYPIDDALSPSRAQVVLEDIATKFLMHGGLDPAGTDNDGTRAALAADPKATPVTNEKYWASFGLTCGKVQAIVIKHVETENEEAHGLAHADHGHGRDHGTHAAHAASAPVIGQPAGFGSAAQQHVFSQPQGTAADQAKDGADAPKTAKGMLGIPDIATKHHTLSYAQVKPEEQKRVHIFFQIYYCMTLLHCLHVAIGMGILLWLVIKAAKGHFSAQYNAPVDIGGLYWHLVDLIWIFLFPLLYLIH